MRIANRYTINQISFINNIERMIETFRFVAIHRNLVATKIAFPISTLHPTGLAIHFMRDFRCNDSAWGFNGKFLS